MTSDAGWTSQESDAARPRPDVLRARQQLQQPPRRVTRPEEREAFARARRQRPARLGSVWVGPHLQPARDADTCQAAPAPRVRQWPQPRPNEGKVPGMGRPVHGLAGPGRRTSDRRQGQRRAGHRDAGVSAARGL